jgi:hypothetical protein
MNKNKVMLFLIVGCLFLDLASVWAENITIRDGRMSADLKQAPLVAIAKDIENQAGISFKGDESLLEETVSVSFKDLPMEDGIRRILANLNYSFMFDDKGKIASVMIMSQGSEPSAPQPQARPASVRPSSPTSSNRRPVVRRPSPASSPLVTGHTRSPAGSRTIPPRARPQIPSARVAPATQAPEESNLPDAFRTIENAPTPEQASDSETALPPAFRVIQNAEPSGGAASGNKETPPALKTQKNVPSPAGSAERARAKSGDEQAPKADASPGEKKE